MSERRTVEAERHAIARELHDVISHSISEVAVRTEAVRRRLGPHHQREADDLRATEATVRQAMVEMRRLLGMLGPGDGAAPLAPQPGPSEFPRLFDDARAAGLAVEYDEVGEPRALAPALGLAAYRIVEEALTNAREHASRARVTVEHGSDALVLEVTDDGRTAARRTAGIRERVALYGGTIENGERPGVRVVLPREEAT